jgi:hypothetical protein
MIGFFGCAEYYIDASKTIEFNKNSLESISPIGLIYNESQGFNWWNGTYKERPVLVNVIKHYNSVSVNIIFLD